VAREALRRDVQELGSIAAYFKLPPNRVVELGSQVVL